MRENRFSFFPLAISMTWCDRMPALYSVLLMMWLSMRRLSLSSSSIRFSSSETGRLAKAELVGANTVHGPATIRQSHNIIEYILLLTAHTRNIERKCNPN